MADDKTDLHVIGVVEDVHEENVEGEAGWQIYYPITQASPSGAQLVVRTSLPPASLATSVLTTLREMNPKQPAAEFEPIRLLVNHAILAAAVFHAAGGCRLQAGAAAGGAGNLRRDFVFGDAADTGDRHSHGPRGERGKRAAAGAGRNLAAGA